MSAGFMLDKAFSCNQPFHSIITSLPSTVYLQSGLIAKNKDRSFQQYSIELGFYNCRDSWLKHPATVWKYTLIPPFIGPMCKCGRMSVRKLRLCWWPSEDLEKYLVEDLVQDIFEDIVEKIVESKIGKQYDNTSGANLVAKFSTTTL